MVGDTVVIQGQRLNLLDRFGTQIATGPGRVVQEDGALSLMVPTERGWMGIWRTRGSATASAGQPFRDGVTVHRVDPLTGELGDALFSYERAESRLAGEIGFYIAPYYQAQPTSTIGPNGHIYYTPGDRYRIEVIDGGTGRVSRQIIGDFAAPAVTRSMVAAAIAQERERVRDARPGSETEMYAKVIDQRAALPVPETRPVFGRMHVSLTGWILALRLDLDEDPLRPGDPTTWDLFDPAGRLQGRLTFRGGTRVLRLTNDGLLAAEMDELDVQSLVRYRFPRSIQVRSRDRCCRACCLTSPCTRRARTF